MKKYGKTMINFTGKFNLINQNYLKWLKSWHNLLLETGNFSVV